MVDYSLKHLLLLDIDGLRPDIFNAALEQGQIPHLAALLGGPEMGRGVQIPALSTAPSITFCAQASLFTGAHPNRHGIPGNQFFDRFGDGPSGKPRFYAFDVGDTLEVDDAIQVFSHNLAGNLLRVPTFYERMSARGKRSVVCGNMYANGADAWIRPSVLKIGRLFKGRSLFGLQPEEYDRRMLHRLLPHIQENGVPDILTMYFMGLDYISHKKGPAAQHEYLIRHVDPLAGELWAVLQAAEPDLAAGTLVAIFSDHGQIEVVAEDRHSLKLGFPFDREMARFFDALGLDVHDYPNEAPNCRAVLALNGGLAHVYLHHRIGTWQTPPDFEEDVLPVGRAFWEAHETGRYASDMAGALSGVLLRNVEKDGWEAPFVALAPDGELLPLQTWFSRQPATHVVDPVNRLNHLTGRYCGDLLLISNYGEQFYFGPENKGVHGGLHPDDSRATLAFGWPGLPAAPWRDTAARITEAVDARRMREGKRPPSIADLVTGLTAVTRQFPGWGQETTA